VLIKYGYCLSCCKRELNRYGMTVSIFSQALWAAQFLPSRKQGPDAIPWRCCVSDPAPLPPRTDGFQSMIGSNLGCSCCSSLRDSFMCCSVLGLLLRASTAEGPVCRPDYGSIAARLVGPLLEASANESVQTRLGHDPGKSGWRGTPAPKILC
jgi:hypothetical protein